jgi:hypothetical protein
VYGLGVHLPTHTSTGANTNASNANGQWRESLAARPGSRGRGGRSNGVGDTQSFGGAVQGLLNAAAASTGAGGGGARAAERSCCEHGHRRGRCKDC